MKANFQVVNGEDFVRHINEVKRASGRDSEEMLKYTMILMLQAGRSATKLGHKNRALVSADSQPETDGEESAPQPGLRRFFRVYRQGSHFPRRIYVPWIPRKRKDNEAERQAAMRARDAIVAKFKRIRRRGLAKASWGWAMKLLSRSIQISEDSLSLAGEVRAMPVEVNRQLTGTSPFIEVTNKLGWILRIAPNIEARMMASADARLQAWLERRWQTGIDRAERRAA